jgi:hypothetical protein
MFRDASTLTTRSKKWAKLPIEDLLKVPFFKELSGLGVHPTVIGDIIKTQSLAPLSAYIKEIHKQSVTFKKNAEDPQLFRLRYGARPRPTTSES